MIFATEQILRIQEHLTHLYAVAVETIEAFDAWRMVESCVDKTVAFRSAIQVLARLDARSNTHARFAKTYTNITYNAV
jgi:hypothetical protein